MSEVANLYAILHNRLCDQEAHGWWRRCQQTCRQWSKDWKTVVDHGNLRDAPRGTASLAGCHSRDSLLGAIRGTIIDYSLKTLKLSLVFKFVYYVLFTRSFWSLLRPLNWRSRKCRCLGTCLVNCKCQ